MTIRILAAMMVVGAAMPALGDIGDPLVGDPFIDGYNGWTAPYVFDPGQSPTPPPDNVPRPNWGIHLRTGALQESSDGRNGTGGADDGLYTPYLAVNDYVTPSDYTLSAQLATYDNDGFGIIFGYQDMGNYFRVGLRNQAPNLGFGQGVSVQKVVGNVITQIAAPNNSFIPPISAIGAETPIDVDVQVSGQSWAVHINGDANPILSGTDPDLAPGQVGAHAWYQRNYSGAHPKWGVELKSIAVSDSTGTLFQDSFAGASPVAWRPLQMTNSAGAQGGQGEDLGNFRLDFRNGTIADDTNGYEWATTITPNVDFIGPGIVVDEPGSANFADYEVRVRMTDVDDDGIGVLLRVQDDNTFYRVNFASQSMGTNEQRAPQGLSVQKVKDGVWSELFRDDQNNPLFVYQGGSAGTAVPFDVSVMAIGDQLFVRVINDPDGAATVINYPVITDLSDPILTGTAGLTNWGSGDVSYGGGVIFSRYGGVAGLPFIIEIPEPAACLLMVAGGLLFWRRRGRRVGWLVG